MEKKIKRLDATDERQYMIHEEYEVYEKQGAPIGAATFHYHNLVISSGRNVKDCEISAVVSHRHVRCACDKDHNSQIAVFFMPNEAFLPAFLINAVQVFLGQMIVCYVFGIPFYFAMKRVRF